MPTVPTYERQHQLGQSNSAGGSSSNARVRPVSPGGRGGPDLRGINQAISGLAEHFERKQQRESILRASELRSDFTKYNIDAIHGEQGLNSKRGRDYLDNYEGTMEGISKYRDRLLENEDDRTKQLVMPHLDSIMMGTLESSAKQRNVVFEEYEKEVYVGNVKTVTSSIISNIQDEYARKNGLDELLNLVDERSAFRGIDPASEGAMAMKEEFTSAAVKSSVMNLIYEGEALAGESLLQTLQDEGYGVTPDDMNVLTEAIEKVKPQEIGQNTASAALAVSDDPYAQLSFIDESLQPGSDEWKIARNTATTMQNTNRERKMSEAANLLMSGKLNHWSQADLGGLNTANIQQLMSLNERVDDAKKPTSPMGHAIVNSLIYSESAGDANDIISEGAIWSEMNHKELKLVQSRISRLHESGDMPAVQKDFDSFFSERGLDGEEFESLRGTLMTEALINGDSPKDIANYMSNVTLDHMLKLPNRNQDQLTERQLAVRAQTSAHLVAMHPDVKDKESLYRKAAEVTWGVNERNTLALLDSVYNRRANFNEQEKPEIEWKFDNDTKRHAFHAMTGIPDTAKDMQDEENAMRWSRYNLLLDDMVKDGYIHDRGTWTIARELLTNNWLETRFRDEYFAVFDLVFDKEDEYLAAIRERNNDPEYTPNVLEMLLEANNDLDWSRANNKKPL